MLRTASNEMQQNREPHSRARNHRRPVPRPHDRLPAGLQFLCQGRHALALAQAVPDGVLLGVCEGSRAVVRLLREKGIDPHRCSWDEVRPKGISSLPATPKGAQGLEAMPLPRSQQTPVTFPMVSPEAKRLCGEAVVAAVEMEVGTYQTGPTIIQGGPTMSSREIAELTGKEHKHVLFDIRKMLEELGFGEPGFRRSYISAQNKHMPEFRLPKDLTITLVSGYSIAMRHRIVTRWMELEAVR